MSRETRAGLPMDEIRLQLKLAGTFTRNVGVSMNTRDISARQMYDCHHTHCIRFYFAKPIV